MNGSIVVSDVGKRYFLKQKKENSGIVGRFFGQKTPFWALRDISFNVSPGESVGLIGPNGAGKSTLLKLLSRVIKPTMGNISLHGTVGALIEVGAGFHPELTGRENIFLNSAILGIPKQKIKANLDSIIDFAELSEFIDIPVKRYSSGMYVRLGFAVATFLDPDILLVDEILAVGDMSFQKKCFKTIKNFRDSGKTFFLVSHNPIHISNMCKRCIFVDKGRIVADGPTEYVLNEYSRNVSDHQDEGVTRGIKRSCGTINVNKINLYSFDEVPVSQIVSGDGLIVEIEYSATEPVIRPKIEIGFSADGYRIGQINTSTYNKGPDRIDGNGILRCYINNMNLVPNCYEIDIWISDRKLGADLFSWENAKNVNVSLPDGIIIGAGRPGFIMFGGEWQW